MAPLKRKLLNKTVFVTCKASKDLEQGMSNKRVAEKYGVSRNTVSTWVENMEKLLALLEKKGKNSKQQKPRSADFKKVGFTPVSLVNKKTKNPNR